MQFNKPTNEIIENTANTIAKSIISFKQENKSNKDFNSIALN
jgi:hypothetical protein